MRKKDREGEKEKERKDQPGAEMVVIVAVKNGKGKR